MNEADSVKRELLQRRSTFHEDYLNMLRNSRCSAVSSLFQNYGSKRGLLSSIKIVALISLPHLTLLVLFLLYALIGAAIFNEIEHETLNSTMNIHSTPSLFNSIKLKQELNAFNIRKQQLQVEIQQLLAAHKESTQNIFLLGNNGELAAYLSGQVEKINKSKQLKANPSHFDVETYDFIAELKRQSESKSKTRKTSSATLDFDEMGKHLSEFKANFKSQLVQVLNEMHKENLMMLDMFNKEQKRFEKAALDHIQKLNMFESLNEDKEVDSQDDHQNAKPQSILTSFYFIMTSLSSIGFRGVIPQTSSGRLFIMIYLIIGLPLTLVLMSDIGKLITHFINLLCQIYAFLCADNYYDYFTKRLEKSRVPLAAHIYSLIFIKVKKQSNSKPNENSLTKNKTQKSTDTATGQRDSTTGDKSLDLTNKTMSKTINEILVKSLQNSADTFDFSFGLLFALALLYLTLGAVFISEMSHFSLFDAYYFLIFTLGKIDSHDLVIDKAAHMFVAFVYILVGMSFFALILKRLQEATRLVLIKSGQNLILEIMKFVNQFGYNLKLNDVSLVFSNSIESIRFLKHNNLLNLDQEVGEAKQPQHLNAKIETAVEKCDKQTQITTLLYSKFRRDQYLSGEQKIASVLPNSAAKYTLIEQTPKFHHVSSTMKSIQFSSTPTKHKN